MSGWIVQVVQSSANLPDSGYDRGKNPTRPLDNTDPGRAPVSHVAALFRGLALRGGFHPGGHRDAGCRGGHRRDTLPELDIFALPTRLRGDWSHRGLDGTPHRDCPSTNPGRSYLCSRLCPQRLCSGHAHHDRRSTFAGHGRRRIGVNCVHRRIHTVSEKTVGTDYRGDFRSLGGVFLVRPVDRRVFCIRGKLARSVLGVCGAGIGSSAGGPTAFKKAVSNTKGTDPEDALGTALPFKRRGAGNLSSRGDDLHRGRKRLMCRRCPSAAGFSQAGCGQREPYFSARCPQPPDGLRIRPDDDVGSLHGNHRADGLWPPPHVYYFWGRAFGSWLYHCLGVTGLDRRGDQHVRCQWAN